MKICNNIYVDNVYCLYLDEFPKRKEAAITNFKNANIPVEMFKGVYIKGAGYVGCRLGHLNILKDAKSKKYKNVMICEDDITFTTEFPINITVPDDWGMFYLSYYEYDNKSIICENSKQLCENTNFSLLHLFYARSTLCYIVNESHYDMLINYISTSENAGVHSIIDMYYANIVQNTIPCYGIYPLVTLPISDYSTVSDCEIDSNIVTDVINASIKTYNKNINPSFYSFLATKQPFIYYDTEYNHFIPR
jgi:GR25 family glycosyltransferase involved in LPS biosynthesis